LKYFDGNYDKKEYYISERRISFFHHLKQRAEKNKRLRSNVGGGENKIEGVMLHGLL
jgi:hypothetical protein